MKHHSPRGGRFLILGIACLSLNGQAFAQQKEEIPRGTLTVDNTLIRIGTQSQLSWQIQYPESVKDVIEVSPTTITSKEELQMRVRILGSKLKNNNGHGNNVDGMDSSNPGNKPGVDASGTTDDEKKGGSSDQPVEIVWSKNKSDWARIFYGSRSTVIPTNVVLDTVIAKTDVIDFGARGYLTDWLPLYSTSSDCGNLIVLKNGDPTPPQLSGKQYGQIDGFIKPYLSTNGQKVKIGKLDLLILVELDQTDPRAAGFDYQDLGILVTFD